MMIDISRMNVSEFITQLLDLSSAWLVENVDFSPQNKTFHIHLTHSHSDELVCPVCGEKKVELRETQKTACRYFPLYDFNTQIESQRYWIVCPQHGAQKVKAPWEEKIDEYLSINRIM